MPIANNATLCATHQAAYLLRRQIESQGREFLEHGGFTERLHAARVFARDSQTAPDAPACPLCGKPMRRRTDAGLISSFARKVGVEISGAINRKRGDEL